MGHLRAFNLNVIHDENLRRRLPHQPGSWTSKPVKGGELCRGIHVAMLQDCQNSTIKGIDVTSAPEE